MEAAATWATAVGTLLLAAVAVFQDKIRRFLTSAKLELRARVAQPDCHKTTWRVSYRALRAAGYTETGFNDFPCYYFRVAVTNSGNAEAREVELYASSLKRKRVDGSFEDVERFVPMNLLWSHFRQPFLPVLSPKMPKMCDLAHIIRPQDRKELGHDLANVPDNKVILAFDLQVEPNMKGHLVEPGTYKLSLVLAAANVVPHEYTVEINFPGEWYDDEFQMLSTGFGMRLI